MPKTQHRHFDDDNNEDNAATGMLKTVATELQNIDDSQPSRRSSTGRAAVNGSTSDSDNESDDDDDDAAPEAIQASSAKSIERERLSKLQSTAKQAKQKKEAATKKKQQPKTADRKGKGKAAIQEDISIINDTEEDETAEAAIEQAVPQPSSILRRNHQVFNDDDEQRTPSTSAPRLDPALFQQADAALEKAKQRALQEERERREEAALAAGQGKSGSSKRGRKRSRPEDKTTRVVGDIVVQQLAPETAQGAANIDPSTALTPASSEKFLKDRLFKRKKARLIKPNANGDSKGKKEEKPFLLFDPLLDKAPKKKEESKGLTRAEMEERLRFRKSAQTTFSKTQRRTMGPSLAFGAASAGRKQRS